MFRFFLTVHVQRWDTGTAFDPIAFVHLVNLHGDLGIGQATVGT